MSHQRRSSMASKWRVRAPVFAALGDETRLSLVAKLCGGRPHLISPLAEGSELTPQAITKHLRVLGRGGIVHSVRAGRESPFEIDTQAMGGIKENPQFRFQKW